MGTTSSIPTAVQLQQWANTPELARENIRSILAAIESDESLADWATEALENCGSPSNDELEFLERQLQSKSHDVVYWACKLLARLGTQANGCQLALCNAITDVTSSEAVKKQALITLGRIGTLEVGSRLALQQFMTGQSTTLSSLASKLLESPT